MRSFLFGDSAVLDAHGTENHVFLLLLFGILSFYIVGIAHCADPNFFVVVALYEVSDVRARVADQLAALSTVVFTSQYAELLLADLTALLRVWRPSWLLAHNVGTLVDAL